MQASGGHTACASVREACTRGKFVCGGIDKVPRISLRDSSLRYNQVHAGEAVAGGRVAAIGRALFRECHAAR